MARFSTKSFRRFSLRTQVSSSGKIGLMPSRRLTQKKSGASKKSLASNITSTDKKLRGKVET